MNINAGTLSFHWFKLAIAIDLPGERGLHRIRPEAKRETDLRSICAEAARGRATRQRTSEKRLRDSGRISEVLQDAKSGRRLGDHQPQRCSRAVDLGKGSAASGGCFCSICAVPHATYLVAKVYRGSRRYEARGCIRGRL